MSALNPKLSRSRPWGTTTASIIFVALLVGISVAGSKAVEPSAMPKALRFDSGLLFHVVLAGIFLTFLYVALSVLTAAIVNGGPPTKMGVAGFSYENEAVAAIGDGAKALAGLETQMERMNGTLDTMLKELVETQDAIVALSEQGSLNDLAEQARERKSRLILDSDAEALGQQQATAKAIESLGTRVGNLKQTYELARQTRGW